MPDLLAAVYAGLGAVGIGFVPIVVWLTFWFFEDWRHPEPRARLIFAFIVGMLAIPAVIPLQKIASELLILGGPLLVVWALIEESTKLVFGLLLVLWHRSVDEPIDYPIYLITIALGFAALENALFLFSPLSAGHLVEGAITGDLRFIGATLIHVLGASVMGGALALSFYKPLFTKIQYALCGVILATALHAVFNLLILTTGAEQVLIVFLGVWVSIVFVLLAMERIKGIRRPAWWEKMFTR